MRVFVLLIISVMLAASLEGCALFTDWDEFHAELRKKTIAEIEGKELRIDEIDNNRFMISESLEGYDASKGYTSTLKNIMRKKAIDHCAKQNKAFTLISMTGGGGWYSDSYSSSSNSNLGLSGLATGGLTGVNVGGGNSFQSANAGSGADMDLVFSCRERTTPAPTTDTP